MTAVILQSRIDSSRLPGKSLLSLGGKPLVLRVMEALNRIPAGLRILACPEDSQSAFSPLADEAGFKVFTGPKDDVLGRYCLVLTALSEFGIRYIIRATGDNPFVFADAAAAISREAITMGADYSAYNGLPLGAGVEVVSAKALLRARTEASQPHEREHVCPYLYSRPDTFLLHRPTAPSQWNDGGLRITVDTKEDYFRAQVLYNELDRLEKNGDLPREERYKGTEIIKAYKEVENGD